MLRAAQITNCTSLMQSLMFPVFPCRCSWLFSAGSPGKQNAAALATMLLPFQQPCNLSCHPAVFVPCHPSRYTGLTALLLSSNNMYCPPLSRDCHWLARRRDRICSYLLLCSVSAMPRAVQPNVKMSYDLLMIYL